MERIDLSSKSYILLKRDAVKITSEQFETLMSLRPMEQGHVVIYGKKMKIPRYQKLYGKATYSFSGVTVQNEPLEHPVLIDLLNLVNELEGQSSLYNGMLVNWYLDGSNHIGPHADDETDLVDGAPIYSFSFGATRIFRFHPKGGGAKVLDVQLEDGTMVAMCGDCQKEFKHSVPKSAKCSEPRINVTIRAFK